METSVTLTGSGSFPRVRGKFSQSGGAAVKTYLFRVELREEADGRWSVWVPPLPGLTTWGHTKEEALRNIQDAAEAYVEDMIDAGEAIPLAAGRIDLIDAPAVSVTV
jgi:predicted RNase H-like HicB family nuclease